MNLSLKEYILGVSSGKFSPQEVVKHYMQKAKSENEKYFAYVRFHEEYVDENIESFSQRPLK
jgi:Asp-tRNA(Asn)/Glu-tRNA(Gln) amidotransferase A subunit family amidase